MIRIVGQGVSSVASVFIGRTEELSRLEARLEFQPGAPPIVVVEGEAGIGKSRLVAEFSTRARDRGVRVLSGNCLPLGVGYVPYVPVVQALRSLASDVGPAGVADLIGTAANDLAAVVPELAPDLASAPSVAFDQGAFFELIRVALTSLARSSPVVFILEDLHWADPSTQALLAFLGQTLGRESVLIVVTVRDDELHRRHPLVPLLLELGRGGTADRVRLGPFGSPEVRLQLAAILDTDPADELVALTLARSEGNPFIIEELVASGVDRDSLPDTLRATFLNRVQTLPADARAVVDAVAIAGEATHDDLASMMSIDDQRLSAALRAAIDGYVVVVTEHDGYAFRHALMQEAVYDDLLPGERTRLHARAAGVLTGVASSRVDRAARAAKVAHHWHRARNLPRALESSIEAGRATESVGAFAEALDHYERALELWPVDGDAEVVGLDRPALQELAGSAAGRIGHFDRALSFFRAALGGIDEREQRIHAARLHELISRYLRWTGDLAAGLEASAEALRLIPTQPPSIERARILVGRAGGLMLAERTAESKVCCEEAIAVADEIGARAERAAALAILGVNLAILGEGDRGISVLHESVAIVEQQGDPYETARTYNNLAWVLEYMSRYEESAEVAFRGAELSRRMGMARSGGANQLANAASSLFRLGRWEDAEDALRRAAEAHPTGIPRVFVSAYFADLAVARGHVELANDHLRAVGSLSTTEPQLNADICAIEARLRTLERDWEGARRAVARGLAFAAPVEDPTLALTLASLGLEAEANRADEARARRRSADVDYSRNQGHSLMEAVRRATGRRGPPLAAVLAMLCEGEWSRLEDRAEPELWESLAKEWDGLSVPHAAAYARFRQAEALLAVKRRSSADAPLRAALEEARRLGAQPLADEVVLLARRARIDVEPSADVAEGQQPSRQPRLSNREAEVLALVAQGLSNAQIGEALFISTKTASSHVSHILTKLGAASRAEATALAYQAGLLES